jgi:hypothetical protein
LDAQVADLTRDLRAGTIIDQVYSVNAPPGYVAFSGDLSIEEAP